MSWSINFVGSGRTRYFEGSLDYFAMSDNELIAVIFGSFALLCFVVCMVYGSKMVEFLKSRGEKAHYWKIRWMLFSYINRYKKITISENGHVGPLMQPMAIAWVFFLVFIALAVYFGAIL